MNIKEKERREKEAWLSAFGIYLKKLRIRKGITGAELARRLYMDKPNISRLEKGRVNPSLYLIKQICEALEISLEDFFKKLNTLE